MPMTTIQEKANEFSYISFKLQANMHSSDKRFYGLASTVARISSCIFACASGSTELLIEGKTGMIEGFNKLKREENIPILCYETIEKLITVIDEKLTKRIA